MQFFLELIILIYPQRSVELPKHPERGIVKKSNTYISNPSIELPSSQAKDA